MDKKINEISYSWPIYDMKVKNAVSKFLDGETFNTWNLGNIYTDVPQKFAKELKIRHGCFVSSGTSGLHASLMALPLKPGDEVIVPAMTFIRAVTPLVHLGLQPVLADIDPLTGNIDPESVLSNISEKTRAIIVVHMWGIPADCKKLRQICDEKGLFLIEDLSHALFSECDGRAVGSWGDVSFASLQRKKTFSVGEGGIVFANDNEIFDRILQITHPGSFNSGEYPNIDFSGAGLNMRINPLAAVIAEVLFNSRKTFLEARQSTAEIFTRIFSKFPEFFEIPKIPEYANKIAWYSYRPKLKGISLENLVSSKLWKFSEFGYPLIADSNFWKKDNNYFPFSSGIKPKCTVPLRNYETYMNQRIAVAFPTVSNEYWDEETIALWEFALAEGLKTKA